MHKKYFLFFLFLLTKNVYINAQLCEKNMIVGEFEINNCPLSISQLASHYQNQIKSEVKSILKDSMLITVLDRDLEAKAFKELQNYNPEKSLNPEYSEIEVAVFGSIFAIDFKQIKMTINFNQIKKADNKPIEISFTPEEFETSRKKIISRKIAENLNCYYKKVPINELEQAIKNDRFSNTQDSLESISIKVNELFNYVKDNNEAGKNRCLVRIEEKRKAIDSRYMKILDNSKRVKKYYDDKQDNKRNDNLTTKGITSAVSILNEIPKETLNFITVYKESLNEKNKTYTFFASENSEDFNKNGSKWIRVATMSSSSNWDQFYKLQSDTKSSIYIYDKKSYDIILLGPFSSTQNLQAALPNVKKVFTDAKIMIF